MIVTEKIKMKINSSNIKKLEEFGYSCIINKEIDILVTHLSKNSHYKIDVKCSVCQNIKNIVYKNYNKITDSNTKKYFCSKCAKFKTKLTNLERYGVECSLNNKTIKEKAYESIKKNYNVSHISKSDIIKDKIKNTNLKKYGVEYYLQSDDKKQKTKNTNLKKYGVDIASKSEIVKNKIKNTNLKKYGVDIASKSQVIKDKIQSSVLEKFRKHPNIIKKIKNTNKAKYGFEIASKSEIVKNKIKNTNLRKYGISNTLDLEHIKEKRIDNYIKWNKEHILEKYVNKIDTDLYDIIGYENLKISINHKKCENDFYISTKMIYERLKHNIEICTFCKPINDKTSQLEIDVKNFLDINKIEYVKDRKILDGKELDIYIPSHNLAIEMNGLYWHSEFQKDKKYHLNKSLSCQEKGIKLVHIWEDEWIFKQDIIKSMLSNKLRIIQNKIYARCCEIKIVEDDAIIKKFLENNHIKGFIDSTITIGLYHNNILVYLMCFNQINHKYKIYELNRFCSVLNTNIVGAFTKLFKYFKKNFIFDILLSYSDTRMYDGMIYQSLGFKKIYTSEPKYYWCKKLKRFDIKSNNIDLMYKSGYFRIYDCGYYKWVLKNI